MNVFLFLFLFCFVFFNISLPGGGHCKVSTLEEFVNLWQSIKASWNNRDKQWKNAKTSLSDVFTAIAVLVSSIPWLEALTGGETKIGPVTVLKPSVVFAESP